MYPAYMEESIRKVIATRDKRLKETLRRLNDTEKNTLLEKFHPDFRKEHMRELKVGVNKGDLTPKELADLLEGNSRDGCWRPRQTLRLGEPRSRPGRGRAGCQGGRDTRAARSECCMVDRPNGPRAVRSGSYRRGRGQCRAGRPRARWR